MAKSQTITFNIIGNDQLSAVLRNAQNVLKNFPRKILSQQKALGNAQGLLKNIEAYKQLQNSIRAMQAEHAKLGQDKTNLFGQWKDARKQLDDMRAAYQRLKDVYKDNKSDLLRDQLKAARGELRAQEKLLSNLGKSYDAIPQSALKLQQQLAAQQQKLAQLRIQIPTGNLAAAESALRAQIDQTTNSLNREIAAFERRNQAAQQFSQAQQDMANAWSNFQNALQTADTLMTPFTSSVDKAIAFEHTMSTLKSISQMDLINAGKVDEAAANMRRLEAHAKELGATTIFTAQQVGEAMVYIARTGWASDAVDASIEPILKLAAATRTDIERAADITTNIMTAFGHGSDQIAHDTDVFNYVVNHSNQTLEQFGEAMKYAAPVAKLFGASIEETAMMTKFAADAGVQASMAGTSIRRTMLRLVAPPKQASKALDELGVSAADSAKEWAQANEVAASYGVTLDANASAGRQFISIMEQLDKGMAGKSDQEKLAAMSAIVGVNAVSGAANIFGAGAGKAKNFTELLEQCKGTLNQTYSVMTDDTFGAKKSFESAWEAMQLSVGQSLLKITQALYKFGAPKLIALSQFVDEHPKVVQAAAAIAAALAAATVAVAGFSLAMAGVRFFSAGLQTAGILFGGLGGQISTVATALAAFPFKHPALLALAAIALVIAANWDKVCSVMKRVADAFNAAIPEWKAGHFAAAADAFKAAWLGAIDTVEGRLKTLGEVNLAPMADLFKQVNPAAPQPSTLGEKTSEIPIDHSTIENAIAQTAGVITEGGQQAADAIKLAGETQAQTLATSTDTTALMFDAVNAATQDATNALYMASPATQALAYSSLNATGNVDQLSASSGGATGNINSLSGSSSQAAGSISGLGAAAQSAISALMSAGAQAASSIGGAVGAIWSAIGAAGSAGGSLGAAVASNAEGGIYSKGQFLTTFAEKSPEAAIPLDGSTRAFNLWTQTGKLLGIGNEELGMRNSITINVNISGNAERQDVYDGVQAALPDLRGLLEDFYHEQRRRSFA